MYVAQAIPQIDTAGAEKSPFRTETNSLLENPLHRLCKAFIISFERTDMKRFYFIKAFLFDKLHHGIRSATLLLLATLLICALSAQTPTQAHAAVPVFDIPANLTLCGERVPLERRDIWEMMDFALVSNVYGHSRVTMWIKRAHRYFPYIEKKLKEKNMPDDLKYIVIAESDLKTYYDVSPAGAVGPWQFMEATAKRFGLRVDKWIDERRNFERATDAALNYLSDLHKRYKSWILAAAAYNCGENRVSKNMGAQGVASYFDLDLPQETELYIFRILAAKVILSYPEYYGYRITPDKRYPPFDNDRVEVTVSKELSIIAVARACGTTYKAIKEMNPEFRQDVIPAGRHMLFIPKGKANLFKAKYKNGI